jgi:hypothetical protein
MIESRQHQENWQRAYGCIQNRCICKQLKGLFFLARDMHISCKMKKKQNMYLTLSVARGKTSFGPDCFVSSSSVEPSSLFLTGLTGGLFVDSSLLLDGIASGSTACSTAAAAVDLANLLSSFSVDAPFVDTLTSSTVG